MPRALSTERTITPHLALIAVQILFGTWPIIGKIALKSISSTSLVGIRLIGAALIFALLQRRLAELRKLSKWTLGWLLITSLLGVVINQLIFVKGLTLTTVINATLLSTTIPVFTLVVSIALGYDRASPRHAVGIGLAALGVIYLVDPFQSNFSSDNTLGNLLIVVNSFCYGAYIAVSRDLVRKYGALDLITWIFVLGAILTLPLTAYSWSFENWTDLTPSFWISVAYIITVPTVGAYYLNAWALGRLPPSIVSIYIYLQPLMAFGLAPVILGERLSSRTLVACGLIFAGVGVVTIRSRTKAVEEVSEHPDAMAH
ncbi:MAG TPA: DMT family transporter [Pyrinomonadaceae bacterium]|nr:DMT family transporter [Pyrinomonadaceae bacterium]